MAKGQAIVRLTAETNDYERKMRQANKTFDGFMKGIGMSPAKFGALGTAIAATTGALKVAKDAFFNSEKNLDEWGRIVESSKSIYKGFLNAINTGDISGFLSNMNTIVKAARDAYDALDELATYNAFNRVNIAKARAGLTDAIADFREGKGSKEAVSESSQRVISELEEKRKKQLAAYVQSVRKVARERGVNPAMLLQVMTGSYGTFKELKDTKFSGSRTVFYGGSQLGGGGGSYEVAVPVGMRERLAAAVQNLNDTEIDTLQAMGEAAEMTAIEINNQRKTVARILNGRGGGGGGGGSRGGRGGGGGGNTEKIDYAADSIEAQERLVQGLTEKWKKASAELRDGYNQELQKAQKKLEAMQNPVRKMTEYEGLLQQATMKEPMGMGNFTAQDITPGQLDLKSPYQILTEAIENLRNLQLGSQTTEQWQGFDKAIEEATRKLEEFTGAVENPYGKTGRELQQALQPFNMLDQGLNQIIGGIEGLGIEIPKGIKDVMSGFQSIIGILSGIATILIAIEAFSALPFFSHGGVVRAAGGRVIHGRSYSGDNQLVRVNAGETILTQAQAGILASRINGMAEQGYQLDAVIEGEQIRLVMNRNSRRRMKGEYVTTKMRN